MAAGLVQADVIATPDEPTLLILTGGGLTYTPTILVVNNANVDASFRIAVVPHGQTLEERHYKCPWKTAPAKSNGTFPIPQVLAGRSSIWVLTDGSAMTFSVSQPAR